MPDTLLVIGIHREELPYGDRVARAVAGRGIDVLRIEHGLSNRRPLYHERFYYTTAHRELYLQVLQQVRSWHRLLIDLHSGFTDAGSCADVYVHDRAFLFRLARRLQKGLGFCQRLEPVVRLVRIIGRGDRSSLELSSAQPGLAVPVCRTVIPEAVWGSSGFLYVGLEIYTQRHGTGDREDLKLGCDLIRCIRASALSEAEAPNKDRGGGDRVPVGGDPSTNTMGTLSQATIPL